MIAALSRLLAARSPRERALLALLAVIALQLAFLVLAPPLRDAGRAARADLVAAQAARDWYLARQDEIAALPAPGASVPPPAPVGLGGLEAGLIDAGLRDAVQSLAPSPGGGVTVGLGAVPFAVVMDWLAGVGEVGYRIAALRLDQAGDGDVTAEIRLEPLP